MKISALFIGNELLNGQTVNLNIHTLGSRLTENGLTLSHSETIPDGMKAIQDSLASRLEKDDVILICGGLGPTEDDITRKAVAAVLGLKTEFSETVCQGLRAYMASRNRTPSDDYYRKQAEVISGATILPNPVGLAPGLLCLHQEKQIYLLPGPPREFNPMVTQIFIPDILKKFPSETVSHLFHIMGISESNVEESFQAYLKKYTFVEPAYCANLGHVKLTITFNRTYLAKETELIEEVKKIYGNNIASSEGMMEDIATLLQERNWTLATAESCTGGGIGYAITAFAGASSFFLGSINTYANSWKVKELNVAESTLNTVGAVSEDCAKEMVNGLKTHGADCGIAVTGIAGPSGGSAEKPIGLVYIATMTPEGTEVSRHHFGGNRTDVRAQTVRYALNQFRLQLLEGRPASECPSFTE